MRAVIQRTDRASVASTEGYYVKKIGKGLLVLLGIEENDTEEKLEWLVNKLLNLRIFSDPRGIDKPVMC